MLVSLSIRDFVIVDALELEFAPGFTVLTGETGAGKSILIDALQLALGGRGEAGVVREGGDTGRHHRRVRYGPAVAAAGWPTHELTGDSGGLVLLRRTVDAQGKSRAWINGAAATLAQLRELGRATGRHPRPACAPVAAAARGPARTA